MATAAAVQKAIGRLWSETGYECRHVAIACFSIDGKGASKSAGCDDPGQAWVDREVVEHNGASVDVPWPCFLAVFPRLDDAVQFETRLRVRLKERVRIGVKLGDFTVAPDGTPGAASLRARGLMERCEPGDACFSVLAGEPVTSHSGTIDGGEDPEPAWRAMAFAGLQWPGLLAYALRWFTLIYWRVDHFARHGSYPCWPAWLCD